MWPVALISGCNTNTADMSSRPDNYIPNSYKIQWEDR